MSIRVLIAKPGLDGHDVGAKVVAQALREAGMEVLYTGLRQTPEAIARAALEEDVDVVGLSILSGAHLALCAEVKRALEKEKVEGVVLMAGGVIPERDRGALEELGFAGIFPGGSKLPEVVRFIQDSVKAGAEAGAGAGTEARAGAGRTTA